MKVSVSIDEQRVISLLSSLLFSSLLYSTLLFSSLPAVYRIKLHNLPQDRTFVPYGDSVSVPVGRHHLVWAVSGVKES